MANYFLTNGTSASGGTQQAIASAYTQATITVSASTTAGGTTPFRRGKLYDILLGTAGTPADSYVEWSVDRTTVSSTSTNLQANPLDPADAACVTQCEVNSSQFGTIGAEPSQLLYIGMNQRASYRWVCAPGSELVWAATASQGIALRPRGTATVNPTASIFFQEQ